MVHVFLFHVASSKTTMARHQNRAHGAVPPDSVLSLRERKKEEEEEEAGCQVLWRERVVVVGTPSCLLVFRKPSACDADAAALWHDAGPLHNK